MSDQKAREVTPDSRRALAELMGCDVMVEKIDGFYWCPDCPTYSTPFALAFAHHRRTVSHPAPSSEEANRGR